MPVCLPVSNPDNHWKYCPSYSAAILFAVLFGLTTIGHIYQSWRYKKTSLMWVLVMGAVWEFIAATSRITSINSPTQKNPYEVSFVFLVLAPLWINAFDYMVLGRLIWYYLPEKQLAGIPATKLAVYFVLMDITSFIIQLAGALMTTGNNTQSSINGLHVYTAGVCIQECVILGFFGLSIFFFRRFKNLETTKDKRKGVKIIVVLYSTLLLISWRVVFRIVEFSAGSHTPLNNEIDGHEWYVYVFDIAPMFLALITYHIYHPGKVLVGPDAEYPKPSKEEKALKKQQKRDERQERKKAKSEKRLENSSSELMERDVEARGLVPNSKP